MTQNVSPKGHIPGKTVLSYWPGVLGGPNWGQKGAKFPPRRPIWGPRGAVVGPWSESLGGYLGSLGPFCLCEFRQYGLARRSSTLLLQCMPKDHKSEPGGISRAPVQQKLERKKMRNYK